MSPAAVSGCVLADHSSLGRVRMLGKDRQDLLHRLSTNEIKALKPGQGNLTVFLTPKGRILDLVHALIGESDLLLITSAGNGERTRSWLDQYIFREDVRLEDAGAEACLGLYGLSAPQLLGRLATGDWKDLPMSHQRSARLGGHQVRVARTFPLGGAGYLLLGGVGQSAALREVLIESGALPADEEALERLRVAAGVPALGKELTEDYNPWEAHLDRAISLTKGCYLGQEVVARLDTYKKIQRRLMALEIDAPILPPAGSPIVSAGQEIGRITSAVPTAKAGTQLALGYLPASHSESGESVSVAAGGSLFPARVRNPALAQ